jgi:hypothetical protein
MFLEKMLKPQVLLKSTTGNEFANLSDERKDCEAVESTTGKDAPSVNRC